MDATLKGHALFGYKGFKANQPYNVWWAETQLKLHAESEQLRVPKEALYMLPEGIKKVYLRGIVTNRDLEGSALVTWLHERCGKSEEAHSVGYSFLTGEVRRKLHSGGAGEVRISVSPLRWRWGLLYSSRSGAPRGLLGKVVVDLGSRVCLTHRVSRPILPVSFLNPSLFRK
jgi:hypothetical protein